MVDYSFRNELTLNQFVDGVGPTLRSIFPLTFKKNDAEAARNSYAVWHYALKMFDVEQVVANLIEWQATHTRTPKPREIRERLSPSDPGVSQGDGREQEYQKMRDKWEADRDGMKAMFMDFSPEDMEVRKAGILMKRPSWRSIKDLPATGTWWKNLIYVDIKVGIEPEDSKGLSSTSDQPDEDKMSFAGSV